MRVGSRRSSGTSTNWSTRAAAVMSSAKPRARKRSPPAHIPSTSASTRPCAWKLSHASLGGVVERRIVPQAVDQGAGQQGVLESDAAALARTEDMNGTLLGHELFADGAEIDESRHQHPVGGLGVKQGPGAVGGRQYECPILAAGGGVFGGRIAHVEAGQGASVALAGQEDLARRQMVGEMARLVDVRADTHRRTAGGQGMHDGRGRPQNVDDDGDGTYQPLGSDQGGRQMYVYARTGHGASLRDVGPALILRASWASNQ